MLAYHVHICNFLSSSSWRKVEWCDHNANYTLSNFALQLHIPKFPARLHHQSKWGTHVRNSISMKAVILLCFQNKSRYFGSCLIFAWLKTTLFTAVVWYDLNMYYCLLPCVICKIRNQKYPIAILLSELSIAVSRPSLFAHV